jgi:tetratricopeptide (TPR) repeat protein
MRRIEHPRAYVQCHRWLRATPVALRSHLKAWRCCVAVVAMLAVATDGFIPAARAEAPIADPEVHGSPSQAAERHLDQTIILEQRLLKARPNDAEAYFGLADAYVRKGRQTGDITYFNLAGAALGKSLAIAPNLVAAIRELALVLYTMHDFAGASNQAERAIALDPTGSYAYGVLGDADLETGRYQEAQKAYDTMVELRGDLYSYCRRAGLRSVRGDPAGAIADLNQAIRFGVQTSDAPEHLAWAQWQLGNEYYLIGRLGDAESWYQGSLNSYHGYYRALAGLAQVRAAQGRFPEAATLYQQAIAVIPLPEYAASLGDVYAMMGREEDARKQHDLVEFIAKLNGLNRILYNRSLVYYYADHDVHVEQAVALAAEELKVRDDIYGHDAMAWALYKQGKPGAALVHAVRATSLGTKDSKLYYHAGLIYSALGKKGDARKNLARALALNPHFQPLQDRICLSALESVGGHPSKYAAAAVSKRP